MYFSSFSPTRLLVQIVLKKSLASVGWYYQCCNSKLNLYSPFSLVVYIKKKQLMCKVRNPLGTKFITSFVLEGRDWFSLTASQLIQRMLSLAANRLMRQWYCFHPFNFRAKFTAWVLVKNFILYLIEFNIKHNIKYQDIHGNRFQIKFHY